MKHEFLGIVKEGSIEYDDTARYNFLIRDFDGKRVLVEVSEYRRKRSHSQNRYYWGVLLRILAEELGYTPEEIHDVLRYKFLRKHIELENGFDVGGSTTELNTADFEEYLSKIRMWASSELSIWIPEPNEDYPQQP